MKDEIKNENNLVKDAEVERMLEHESLGEAYFAEADISTEDLERSRKLDKYVEFVLLFILGVLVGIAIKTEATRRITIGFDDYQMSSIKQDFDINKLQLEVIVNSDQDMDSTQE